MLSGHHHSDGNSYILVINEALYYGQRLKHSLINPNQIRYHDVDYWDNPYDSMHPLAIEIHEHNLSIPLKYWGTKLSFQTSLPTESELNNLPHVELTSEATWDPENVVLGKVAAKINVIDTHIISAAKTEDGLTNNGT